MPRNLDKMGLLEGVFIQILDDTLVLIIEDEVVGNESLDGYDNRLYLEWSGRICSIKVRCSNQEPRR
jgi:hypothetical protein